MTLRGTVLTCIFIITGLITLNSFTIKHENNARLSVDDGRALFLRYCTLCHLAPDPASLTKTIWESHVLPVMASRMGIIYPNYDPLKGLSAEERAIVAKNNIIPTDPFCSQSEWAKIKDYIINNAPDSVKLDEGRINRDQPLTQFLREDVQLDNKTPSLITGLKYNKNTNTLWIGNYYNQVLNWQYGIGITKKINTASPAVDFNFQQNNTYTTEIGKLYPTELSTGTYAQINDTTVTPILPRLHRPVNTRINDLNNDGVPEIVVCRFGNKTGGLSLFKKKKNGTYAEDELLSLPGAIKCYIKDMDGDGKKDIVAMFSQGDESVYIFYQKDNLKFKGKRVLRFPPNYGTTDLILVDYNNDGLTDLVTVHGDNADYSYIPKNYHGIRLHINQGGNTFKEKFFFPMYGVTRVLAEDFDKDGDIDFVATAFFPEFGQLVNESFIYLENVDKDKFSFKPYIQKTGIPIKTLTLEKADVDGDGDMDIITGNFAQSPGPVPQALDEQWKSAKYGLSIFYNQLYQPKKQ